MGSILLVQSDPDTSDEWAAAVSAGGHSALTAATMREALVLIREGGIEVVVIDTYDPRAGVIELSRSIAALPDAPPLILISSSPDAPEVSARIGAAAFLPKPCDTSEILAAVNNLLGVHRPVRVPPEDELTGPTLLIVS